ncbi:hypothetical protein Syun_015402 [Stephania yunnanensis]|uniref:GPI inositol-deacylase n=1 Tax=Stephania yunnanensis TaxID=152371 RepID=A0AAP0P9P2_9MAGN
MTMLRLCITFRRRFPIPQRARRLFSISSPSPPRNNSINQPINLPNPQPIPTPPPEIPNLPLPLPRKPLIVLSAALISALIASAAILSDKQTLDRLYADLEASIEKSNDSAKRIATHMRQTGVAAAVLLRSLKSVLSSANQEVRSGFEIRVASLLADIAAANESRRAAIVAAGGGAVVDWLLETVAASVGDNCGTQAESARALAYLIADQNVREAVLGRPHAVPNLLRFIFSYQPRRQSKNQVRRSSLDVFDTLRGRSMLVTAIMDIVTSNCDSLEEASVRSSLPAQADMRDIAAAIGVIEEGGMHLGDINGNDDDENGGTGMQGIGLKILGDATVLGLSRTNGLSETGYSIPCDSESLRVAPKSFVLQRGTSSQVMNGSLASISAPGLWDDLQGEHVAVPFAAWALANWALASDVNRSRIQELDQDGHAIMTALLAPERTVKWHASLIARLLLEDESLPLINSVPDWSSSLLSTAFHASKAEDIPLAQMALSAFLVSVEKNSGAQQAMMKSGLHLMREIAKQNRKHGPTQETLAKALELLCTGDLNLSLEESQRWSGILLSWVCGKFSSDSLRCSAKNILPIILEEHGPASIPISQGWLTILLTEILGSVKNLHQKGSTEPKSDKVQTQIDQSNVLLASQIGNQLANAVVSLAWNQLGSDAASVDAFPLADLISLEPFSEAFKNKKKNGLPKFDAADSAVATMKGIKALTELCAEDYGNQEKIVDFGVLCLLRRFLLRDDYEHLAAIEAYDASRVSETQEHGPTVTGDTSVLDGNDSSSVRVPPTAHIRKHAARLLNILSRLPKVQKTIKADEAWCKWLDDCANGIIPGCNDFKLQSYARSTLLNIFCTEETNGNSVDGSTSNGGHGNQKYVCALYDDMIFLVNPELTHWKCSTKNASSTFIQRNSSSVKNPSDDINASPYEFASADSRSEPITGDSDSGSLSSPNIPSECSNIENPLMDIVFIHGLRGGPFKTWRVTENKSSTTSKSGLVENIDQEAGKQGTCWPREWLAADFPYARLLTIKYKTNLTQWSGASLPLQEVSSVLLKKLVAAGIGARPVVFVTHSMGGLVVKQMLHQAKSENINTLVNNTVGVVFYSCPHFGSKLADMPWRMGLVLRPAPTIGELRSGSPRLVELNDFVRHLQKKGSLEVLSFSETMVTPIVEGYGGWAFRMEIVPIESAYPGFGELVVLESTDHINSCKPVNRTDPSYTETLNFLQKLKAHYT